jgi:hypothetical protein
MEEIPAFAGMTLRRRLAVDWMFGALFLWQNIKMSGLRPWAAGMFLALAWKG